MSGELISLRILTVFVRDHDRDRLRLGAGRVSVPIDVLEAETAAAATGVLAGGDIDMVFLDTAFSPTDRAAVLAAARAAKAPPFVLLAANSQEDASKVAAAESADAACSSPPIPTPPRTSWNAACGCGCPSASWWSTIPRSCAVSSA